MGGRQIGRRTVLVAGAALAMSLLASHGARADKSLTVVLESEATILDPHATTVAITRTFSTHVFDTLPA